MNILLIISTDDAETIYNAMRLANAGVKKGDEVSVFMLGKGVLFEQSSNEQFNEWNRFSSLLVTSMSEGVNEIPRSGGIKHMSYCLDGRSLRTYQGSR